MWTQRPRFPYSDERSSSAAPSTQAADSASLIASLKIHMPYVRIALHIAPRIAPHVAPRTLRILLRVSHRIYCSAYCSGYLQLGAAALKALPDLLARGLYYSVLQRMPCRSTPWLPRSSGLRSCVRQWRLAHLLP